MMASPLSGETVGGRRPRSRRTALLFASVLTISLVMLARSQVGGDQLNLLARGWLVVTRGEWTHAGLPTSAGGNAPGSLTTVLMAVPMLVWRDHRSPAVLILLAHVGAWFLLARTLRGVLRREERWLLALLFWVNPWRVHFSTFVWNANFMVPLGVLYLATCWQLRRRSRFWPSLGHVAAIGAAAQLHASFAILVVTSALLTVRRQIRPHWGGAACGAALVGASLVPWASVALGAGGLQLGGEGFLGRGLLYGFPVLRGAYYWLRYASLHLPRHGNADATTFDFSATLGDGADGALVPVLGVVTRVIAPLTVIVPILATVWLWRHGTLRRAASGSPWSDRRWLRGYLQTGMVAALISFALSPTTIMSWQGFVVLPAAVLPVVLYLEVLRRAGRATWVRRVTTGYLAVSLVLLLAMAVGAPHFRPGGRHAHAIALRADHPMLHDLGIDRIGSVTIDPVNGWWPDALPVPAPTQDRR
jgi:hypothetical protein